MENSKTKNRTKGQKSFLDESPISIKRFKNDNDKEIKSMENKLVPVWRDPDDEIKDADGIKNRRVKTEARDGDIYRNRLVENFEDVFGPTPKWAKFAKNEKEKRRRKSNESEDSEDDEELVDTVGFGDSSFRNFALPPGRIKVIKLADLNDSERKEGAIIRSVDFHPTNPVGLVAGSSGTVGFYQVDGNTNAPIQSIEFDNFPLRKAQFSADGDEVYVSSGLVGHFYVYDMRSGNAERVKPNHATTNETIRNLIVSPDRKTLLTVGHHGQMYLFSKNSREIVQTYSINGDVRDVVFSPDANHLLAYSDQGEVYRWDTRTYRCIEKFSPDGAFDATVLAASSKYLACGSNSGYVSILENKYETSDPDEVISCRIRKSISELGNIQTPITSLKFNSTGEILAMGSVDKENAFRLVHIPSCTVFPQFPFVNANYGRPNSIAFSPNSGYLSIGNNWGSAYLFRLKYYHNY